MEDMKGREGVKLAIVAGVVGIAVGYLARRIVLLVLRTPARVRQLVAENAVLSGQASVLETTLERERAEVAELRELNQMKSQFVAVASHELRTPLTTIIGYAKTLQLPGFAEDAATRTEFLQTMERQGDRLLQLIDNLLMTANVENRRAPVRLGLVRLLDVFHEAIETAGHRAHRVFAECEPDVPTVVTDRHMLCRVVQNLLDNALKYSPEGSPCDLHAVRSGDAVEIEVADRGIGIPPEEIGRIFERFYQADPVADRASGGVGLGLSLVHGLVTALAGTIDVESKAGVGTTFRVRIPVEHPRWNSQDGPVDVADAASISS